MECEIKNLVSSTGLTQKAFAERFHIPIRTLEDWIAGRRKPPEYVVWMISELIKKSTDPE